LEPAVVFFTLPSAGAVQLDTKSSAFEEPARAFGLHGTEPEGEPIGKLDQVEVMNAMKIFQRMPDPPAEGHEPGRVDQPRPKIAGRYEDGQCGKADPLLAAQARSASKRFGIVDAPQI